MKKSILFLLIIMLFTVIACGGTLGQETTPVDTPPATIAETTTTTIPPTTTTLAPTTTTAAPTTTVPPPTTEATLSTLEAETAWYMVTGPAMGNFVWLLVNNDAFTQAQGYVTVTGMINVVTSVEPPTARTMQLAKDWLTVAIPVQEVFRALSAEAALAGLDQLISSGATSRLGEDMGTLAIDCGMYNDMMRWMQGELPSDTGYSS
jgi:hypothetical protein